MLEETFDPTRQLIRWLSAIGLSAILAISPALANETSETRFWRAGKYTFSDEQGGFSILNVTGSGTHDDPAVVTQDIQTLGKSVLTIRILPVTKGAYSFNSNWTTLYVQLNVINGSEASWIGYRVELQEELGTPSIYGDGLSFNQITRSDGHIVSDRFARFEVEHEPGDRLTFNDGWVDRLENARFNLFLLDLTPTPVFYIEQRPHLPAS